LEEMVQKLMSDKKSNTGGGKSNDLHAEYEILKKKYKGVFVNHPFAMVSLGGKDGVHLMRGEDRVLHVKAPNGINFVTDSIQQKGKPFQGGGGAAVKVVEKPELFKCGDNFAGMLTYGKDVKICGGKVNVEAPLEAKAVISNEVFVRKKDMNKLIEERILSLQGSGGNFVCKDGWKGLLCGEDADDCNPNPCRHATKCLDEGTKKFRCICKPGWSGDKCSADLKNCKATSCSGHGKCDEDGDGTNKIKCTCDPGFKSNAKDAGLCDKCTVKHALEYSAGCTVKKCATHFKPKGNTCVDCKGVVNGPARILDCGCNDNTSCKDNALKKDGWLLIAITNGGGGKCGPTVTTDKNRAKNEYQGEYIMKPLVTKYFTELKMDCGCRNNGVKGYVHFHGEWKYGGSQKILVNTKSIKLGKENLVWIPDVIGYNSKESDAMWHTHVGGRHYPNFGANFGNINPSQGGWRCGRYVFTCDPQSGAYGNGDTRWTGCGGTRFVRIWMKPK